MFCGSKIEVINNPPQGTTLHLEEDVTLHLEEGATLHFEEDATLHLEEDATLHLEEDATSHLEEDAMLHHEGGGCRSDSVLTEGGGLIIAVIVCFSAQRNGNIKVCNYKHVLDDCDSALL